MQYVLTKKEYDALHNLAVKQVEDAKHKLQEVCSLAAENIPSWKNQATGKLEPYGCLLVGDKCDFYCDDCVVKKFCPYEYKSWSK